MNWAVVMTGGRGTRFWPESRNRRPKPFLKLVGRRTLLEETVHRLEPFFSPSQILIVLQDFLIPDARRLFPRIPPENFLGEPLGRNTAPCCVYAASRVASRDPNAKLVFLPSDQFIRPASRYLNTLKTAFQLVDEKPVLLGMRPTSPHTGYGYLEVGPRKGKINGIASFSVKRFREKPHSLQAQQFLKRGNFFWNGGTFIWRLDAFQAAVRNYFPRLSPAFRKLADPRMKGKRLAAFYRTLPSISIDYAVMEKMKNVHCLLAPFEWKDLGGWEGVAEFWREDRAKNRVGWGEVRRAGPQPIFVKSFRNIVKSNRRLVALVGAEDLVVVDTDDALLVCHRSQAEEIRGVVQELERRRAHRYL